ncbi:hypothetical protein [Nocardiopsis sp. CA-288880]|uniref:hypothetical protein n=1 Tax=Nocardiopsis sp. CA-288880 TaxID=3239995 RepID=UPI003D978740
MSHTTLTSADQATALTWTTITATNGETVTSAHLGWVDLGGQEWSIHASPNADRFHKYATNRELAAMPDTLRAPGVNIVTYPVRNEAEHVSRLLFHAPAFLAERFPNLAGTPEWKPRLLESGHTIREATIATIEDHLGPFPVIARVDQALIDLNDGDLNSMTALLGDGTDRRMVVPILSTDVTTTDVLKQLADSRSRH